MDTSEGNQAATSETAPPSSARQMPMALGAALILNLVCGIAIALRVQYVLAYREDFDSDTRELLTRWNMISPALGVACMALAAAGAAELVRRTSDLAKHGARLLFGGLLALVLLYFFYYYAFYRMEAKNAFEQMDSLQWWMSLLQSTSWHLITLGALLAGWRARSVRVLAAPLIIASLLANPYHFYGEALYSIFEGRWALRIQGWSLDAFYLALLVLVLHHGAPLVDAGGGWERVSTALDRTASALYARLWISAGSITLVMLSFGNRDSAGLTKLWVIGVPLGVALANLVAVSGVLSAGGLTVAKAPRRWFYVAGALLTMATFLSAMQMIRIFHSWPDFREAARLLPIALPVIAALALCLLSEALARLASLLPSLAVAQQALTSRMIVILSQLATVGAQYYAAESPPREPGSVVLLLLITVGTSIVALVSQARLCRALAAQIRERNELPAAVVLAR